MTTTVCHLSSIKLSTVFISTLVCYLFYHICQTVNCHICRLMSFNHICQSVNCHKYVNSSIPFVFAFVIYGKLLTVVCHMSYMSNCQLSYCHTVIYVINCSISVFICQLTYMSTVVCHLSYMHLNNSMLFGIFHKCQTVNCHICLQKYVICHISPAVYCHIHVICHICKTVNCQNKNIFLFENKSCCYLNH